MGMLVNIGKNITLDVDVKRLAQHVPVMEHVVYIGLRNILMDAHASATAKEHPQTFVAMSRELAEKKLASMYAGEVRARVVAEDPIRAQLRGQAAALGLPENATAEQVVARMLELATKPATTGKKAA